MKAVKTDKKFSIDSDGRKVNSDLSADGINSKYLGRHIIRKGTQKQKFFKPPLPCMHFYSNNKELFSDEIDVDNSIIMCGAYDSNLSVIQKTMITDDFSHLDTDPSSYPTVDNLEMFDEAVKILIKKLKPVELPDMDEDDIALTYFDEDT